MKVVVIENPILNSPFEMPQRHFKFDEDGITDETADARRPSSYFIPIASPRKKVKQLPLGPEWTQDRARENDFAIQARQQPRQRPPGQLPRPGSRERLPRGMPSRRRLPAGSPARQHRA